MVKSTVLTWLIHFRANLCDWREAERAKQSEAELQTGMLKERERLHAYQARKEHKMKLLAHHLQKLLLSHQLHHNIEVLQWVWYFLPGLQQRLLTAILRGKFVHAVYQ